MIQKVEMYQAVCDGCGRACAGPGGITSWDTRESAYLVAFMSMWRRIDGKLYCPGCVEYDPKTDSYKPKEKKQ